jgi:integrase
MRLDQINLKQARIWVKRSKNSLDIEQPIEGDELRAIKRYLAARNDKLPWLFVSERGQPLTRQAVNYIVRQAGDRAKLGRVWPHMLRHSAGVEQPGPRLSAAAGFHGTQGSAAHNPLHTDSEPAVSRIVAIVSTWLPEGVRQAPPDNVRSAPYIGPDG